MTDKKLVKSRFEKSFETYDENALIQKLTAKKLIEMLPNKDFENVFEPGAATGILTKEIKSFVRFKKYTGNDITEKSKTYIEKIMPNSNFIEGDIETLEIKDKFDLIISNACLQWCENLNDTVLKLYNLLHDDGILLFSIFGNRNLYEIKDIFGIDAVNSEIKDIQDMQVTEEEYKLYFDNLTEILKHFRSTGVNAVKTLTLTKQSLKNYEEEYEKKYSKDNKLILTYNPVYVFIQKSNKNNN